MKGRQKWHAGCCRGSEVSLELLDSGDIVLKDRDGKVQWRSYTAQAPDPSDPPPFIDNPDAPAKPTREGCLSGKWESQDGAYPEVSGEKVTFNTARQQCAEKGWRLCRKSELSTPAGDAGGTCGTGCHFDSARVWADLDPGEEEGEKGKVETLQVRIAAVFHVLAPACDDNDDDPALYCHKLRFCLHGDSDAHD